MGNISYFSEELLELFLNAVPGSYKKGFIKQIKANRFNICYVTEKVNDKEFMENVKTFRCESNSYGSLILDNVLDEKCVQYFKRYRYMEYYDCITIILKDKLSEKEVEIINILVKNYVKYGRLILIYNKTDSELKTLLSTEIKHGKNLAGII